MKLPPLISEHPRPVQVGLIAVVPAIFGAICGYFLGVSEATYLVLSLIGIVGGVGAGLDHMGARAGALRGLAAGSIFGASILIAHEIHGAEAKAELPDPAILLVVITTVLGVLFAALGGWLRQRYERESILIHTSSKSAPEIPDLDITSYVLEHAAEHADKAALIDGPSGRELSYGDLVSSVRACAAGLAGRGFAKGDVFGIFMPNAPEYAVAFHGATSAGGMSTTVNPLYTAHELTHQMNDSGARFLLTVPPFLDVAREAADASGVEEVFVLGDADGATPFSELLGDPADAPEVEIDAATDLAVLPYSSGTTGLSKGVMLTHRNLVANIVQTASQLDVRDDDVFMGALPFFHIYGMTVIMNLGLRDGVTIVTMPRFDLEQFLDLVETHRVSRGFIVPPIALALAQHPAVEGRDLSSIRHVKCGAAPLGPELSEQLAERLDTFVSQGYGLTETSPVTHAIPFEPGAERAGSIGPPVPGTECRIVDPETGEDVTEVGERGELWMRGPQIMSGYLNNPEATAATVDEDGWLHSGDVAVVDSDGYFQIVDRLKELIKYKGFQVAPAELEALILGHEQVGDVAVIGVPDEEAGELPKAFVVAASDELDHEQLMAWVADQVAPQKRIRLVETVEEIPKSPSGKILRRVLKERAPAQPG